VKRKFSGMKTKFIIIVVSMVISFTITLALLWGSIYTKQLMNNAIDYANEMTELSNNNVDSYLKRARLLAYILQNNKTVTRILTKNSYESNNEMYNDINEMSQILRMGMTGAEYLENIVVVSENGMYFTGGGTSIKISADKLLKYKNMTDGDEISFSMEPAEDSYDYPKLILTKKLKLSILSPSAWAIMTVNCKGLYKKFNTAAGYSSAMVIADPRSGGIVYDKDLENLGLSNSSELCELSQYGTDNSYKICRIKHQKTVVICNISKVTGWKNYIFIPYRELADRYHNMLTVQLLIIAAVVILSVLLSLSLAKHFLKNMSALITGIERVDADHLTLECTITSKDEVELLYHKFQEMIERINQQMEAIKKDEGEKRKLGLKALQAQINPHFLYNSLNTIKIMGRIQEADPVVDACDALICIMRTNMSKKTYHTFQEEIEYLNKYIRLKEFQSANPIKFICKIEEELKDCYILKMLIQPLVENSLKHGGIMNSPNGYIMVMIYSEGDAVQVVCEDNGIGLSEEESREILSTMKGTDSIGLFNISQRILLHYGEDYGVNITGEKGIYTRITLRIPQLMEAGDEDD
jgi:Predicted signal transduction protein with a C-terminal ATPase domain